MSRRECESGSPAFQVEKTTYLLRKARELSAVFSSEWPSVYPMFSIDTVPCPMRRETVCVNQILRLEVQLLFSELQDLGPHVHIAET